MCELSLLSELNPPTISYISNYYSDISVPQILFGTGANPGFELASQMLVELKADCS